MKEIDAMISDAVRLAVRPLTQGEVETIGNRNHPRVSVWPMREKWKKYGAWWTCLAPDEPPMFRNFIGPVLPLMMQLFYIRLSDERVLQLIWERPDKTWTPMMQGVFGAEFSIRQTDSPVPPLIEGVA